MTSRIFSPPAALAAIAAGLGLAACGGSTHTTATVHSSSTPTTRTATVTSTVPATTATTTSAPPPTTSTAAAAPGVPSGCTPQDLGIHLGRSLGAAGTVYTEFDFVNVTSRSCTLMGYPGVSLVLSSGTAEDITNVRGGAGPAHLVTLAPGAKAPFLVGVHGSAAHPCVEATHFRFIPPNDTAYEQIATTDEVCGTSVEVSPVGYGNGG